MEGTATYKQYRRSAPSLELGREAPESSGPRSGAYSASRPAGLCHSDSGDGRGILPIQWPRVPGVTRLVVGSMLSAKDVQGWADWAAIGVGFLAVAVVL